MLYMRLARTPRAAVPAIAAGFGALPLGMFSLAVLLLVREGTGSIQAAGWVSGAVILGEALGMVLQGRLFDRLGQTVPLLAAAGVCLALLVGLVTATHVMAPVWVLTMFALFGGAAIPATTTCMRVLWPTLVENAQERQAAYALMGILFQLAFMVGPPLVSGLLTVGGPAVAVLTAACIGSGSTVVFAGTPASRQWRPQVRRDGTVAGGVVTAGLLLLLTGSAGLGAVSGCGFVGVSALSLALHQPALAGLLLACPSIGELVGATAIGGRSWAVPTVVRLIGAQVMSAGCWAIMALVPDPLVLAAMLFAVGIATAVQSISTSVLLDRVATPGRLATSYTLLLAVMLVGVGGSTTISGTLTEFLAPPWLFAVGAVLAALMGGCTAIGHRALGGGTAAESR